ncbi:Cation/H(+) antiporter 19 [Dendrobium catenatum]|uniref:Cation/H(+) antiporter 19 n=1 Tax=Dendrobium catenatum TaxID=906689 RepID=A0A2I0WTZ4_9ASPA|nr:Cation/H(+) antiporter 19 [Dendrobium catenatum]
METNQLQVLNDETFAIMVMMTLFTTFITTPIMIGIYKPTRKAAPYKHRKIERDDTDSELRILACFYGSRNIPTLINLIESSRGTRRRGGTVYAMHLMELSEHPSAIFMVHKAVATASPSGTKRKIAQSATRSSSHSKLISSLAASPSGQ